MKRLYVLLPLLLLSLLLSAQPQRPDQFSEVRAEFISQLERYMTASKQKAMEDTYKEFATTFKSGMFSETEADQILRTGNRMLAQGMSANPYFSTYLRGLVYVKKSQNGDRHFQEWHKVLDTLLVDKENRRLTSFQQFLDFSEAFFEHGALRFQPAGTSWYPVAEDYLLGFDGNEPFLEFGKLDLLAVWKQDSIFIQETSGRFYPLSQTWKGKNGKVSWERFGWDKEVYAELPDYQFEMKGSLYEVKKARLHYPLFFGTRVIEGDFSDKLTVENAVTGSSYPRFQSYEEILELDNIGKGIKYIGGFRLHGTTIYGYGTKELPARIRIYDDKESMVFRANSELFTIRREDRIVGERVEAVVYFGKDSIYHPSVNVRFDIKKREMELSRGDRGTDRNPFFSSIHGVNIDADHLFAYLDKDSVVIGQTTIPIMRKPDIFFESHRFFNEGDYRRIQNIASSNPIAIIKLTAEKEGTNFIDADLLAKRINPKFTVENIQSLLYDLAAKGFISYDPVKSMVEVKEKVFLYADAAQGKVDFDEIRIKSSTDSTNAVLNLKDNKVEIKGVDNIQFSRRQRVAVIPEEKSVLLKKNRDLDFGGKLFAGFSSMEGKGFHFDYERFQIRLDSIEYLDLFVPTGEVDKNQNPKAVGINSRIENLNGVLLIDAPSNKSGREDIPMFPSLQSKDKAYVFYDYKGTQDSTYIRDSFYFELKPFSFNHLDRFSSKDLNFKGKLVSGSIFPDINEPLTLQEDQSLGFKAQTPPEGLPNYKGKGKYSGQLKLSNAGLQGKGTQNYLGASIQSEDMVFRPKEMLSTAREFNLEEDRKSEVQVPQVHGVDVSIKWRPYKDSMYVTPKETPFDLFKENNHTLAGTLILTPGGLKGNGLLDWDKAYLRSKYFNFGAFSVMADTTEVGIRAFNTKELALKTVNVRGQVDFDKEMSNFTANDEFLETVLPYNQYQTSMNEFDWNMKEETITFNTQPGILGKFISIHPDQDSLRFQGQTAFYDLKTNELNIGGVPFIISADAFVYPDSGLVFVKPGGVMTTLNNARIVADTISKYHVINRATIDIQGRKEYRAKGFYEYNIGDRKQEIEFGNIAGTRIGKGARTEKQVATRATGEVKEEADFYIDHKTMFKGTISLKSESRNLQFDGFARLDADKLPDRQWFSVSSEGDKQDLAIRFNSPKSFDGEILETGLFLSKETSQVYPRVMMPLGFRGDRPILNIKGVFKYNKKTDEFIFGDSSRVLRNELPGNRLVFNNAKATIQGEGRFTLGSGLKYVSVDAAGRVNTAFPPVSSDVMTDEDTSLVAPTAMPVNLELMAGIRLIVPDRLMKILINDIQAATFDAKPIAYLTDQEFYKKAVNDLFPPEKEVKEALDFMSSGVLELPSKVNSYTFLLSPLKMKWDVEYQSFVNTDPTKVGVISIGGTPVNKSMTCYVEFKMQSNEDDRLYIYLKSSADLYYFFGYKQGILSLTSNNPTFMEELAGMKAKDLVMKMPDGETFEIQAVEPGTANMFVRRIQAVGK